MKIAFVENDASSTAQPTVKVIAADQIFDPLTEINRLNCEKTFQIARGSNS